jgi:hypothetical protein
VRARLWVQARRALAGVQDKLLVLENDKVMLELTLSQLEGHGLGDRLDGGGEPCELGCGRVVSPLHAQASAACARRAVVTSSCCRVPVQSHAEQCSHRPVPCAFCEERIPFLELACHQLLCAKCEQCGQRCKVCCVARIFLGCASSATRARAQSGADKEHHKAHECPQRLVMCDKCDSLEATGGIPFKCVRVLACLLDDCSCRHLDAHREYFCGGLELSCHACHAAVPLRDVVAHMSGGCDALTKFRSMKERHKAASHHHTPHASEAASAAPAAAAASAVSSAAASPSVSPQHVPRAVARAGVMLSPDMDDATDDRADDSAGGAKGASKRLRRSHFHRCRTGGTRLLQRCTTRRSRLGWRELNPAPALGCRPQPPPRCSPRIHTPPQPPLSPARTRLETIRRVSHTAVGLTPRRRPRLRWWSRMWSTRSRS